MPNLGGWEWIILLLLLVVLLIGALVSIARSQTSSGTEKAIWVLISLIFPVLGPILWFAIGKRSARSGSARV